MKKDIRDSNNIYVGWSEDTSNFVNYYGVSKGLVGRYDKTSGYWFWMQGHKVGQRGPRCDIGNSEVLKFERTK